MNRYNKLLKRCFFAIITIFSFKISSFYENISFPDYEISCNRACTSFLHEEIELVMKKIYKLWHGLDLMQSIQCAIPNDDLTYLLLIKDILDVLHFYKTRKKEFACHPEELKILIKTLAHIKNHSVILYTPLFEKLFYLLPPS